MINSKYNYHDYPLWLLFNMPTFKIIFQGRGTDSFFVFAKVKGEGGGGSEAYLKNLNFAKRGVLDPLRAPHPLGLHMCSTL